MEISLNETLSTVPRQRRQFFLINSSKLTGFEWKKFFFLLFKKHFLRKTVMEITIFPLLNTNSENSKSFWSCIDLTTAKDQLNKLRECVKCRHFDVLMRIVWIILNANVWQIFYAKHAYCLRFVSDKCIKIRHTSRDECYKAYVDKSMRSAFV